MIRDYTLTSPSLDGILSHESVVYGGLKRPALINRIFDRPSNNRAVDLEETENQKIIESYYHDLYEVLTKKLSGYAVSAEREDDEAVKITAMLQEFIKIKGLLHLKKK